MQNAPAYPVSSADNVLRLLMMLRERGELRVAEAAGTLGVAPSTAHRLLATLRQHEFAVQDRRHVYLPGPALAGISASAPRPDLRAVIHRGLREVVAQCQETAHFMVLEGNGVRFIDGVEGSKSLRCGTRIGLLMPAHVTSGGKALLAELSPAELRELYPDGVLDPVDGHAVTLDSLSRELRKVQAQRFAINIEESEPGISAVGVALRHRNGQPVAALSISVPTIRFQQERVGELVDALHAVAQELAAKL
jgi:DNA-binding IclR family transcriptional regulator